MKRRRPVHMLALVLGVVAAVPSIAAADTSFPAAAGDMTARGDLLVWTPWTGPGRLMSGFGDAAAPLPIPRARFGSVDLGTDARGRACSSTGAARPPVRATAPSTSTTSRANAIVASPRSTGAAAAWATCGSRAERSPSPATAAGAPSTASTSSARGNPSAAVARCARRTSVVRPRRQHRGVHPQPAARRPGGVHLVADDRGARAPAGAAAQPAPRSRAPARVPRPLRSLRRGRAPRPQVRVLGAAGVQHGIPARRRSGRRSSVARSMRARPRRSSNARAGSTSNRRRDRLGSYAVSGDRLYYSRPAYVTGSEAFIAQVAGTPVFR